MLSNYTEKELERRAQEKQDAKIKDFFLHELALLMLAETPIKSTVKNRTKGLRGEIFYSLKLEDREPYTRSRDVILEFAQVLAKAKNLTEIAHALNIIQDLTAGNVMIVEGNQPVTNE